MTAHNDTLEWKKNALRVIETLEARIESLERAKGEPIAVIGLACRVPGASSSDAFWQLLDQGVDAIGEIPADRFDVDDYYDPDPDAPGKMTTRWGGFLPQIDRFDAELFGISPREAVGMDPQQRLLLEVSWEALEHGGLSADRLRGSPTGVFVGISSFDYAQLMAKQDEATIDAYLGTGVAHQRICGADQLLAWTGRPQPGHRYRLQFLVGGRASGLPKPAGWRERPGLGGRGQRDPHADGDDQLL